MENIEIRVATPKDYDGIQQLVSACFDNINQYEPTTTSFSIIAAIEDKIIGHIYVDCLKDAFKGENYYFLNYVCVDPLYRQHKVATKMLIYLDMIALKEHITYIELTSSSDKIAANHLYLNNGFTIRKTNVFHKKIKRV